MIIESKQDYVSLTAQNTVSLNARNLLIQLLKLQPGSSLIKFLAAHTGNRPEHEVKLPSESFAGSPRSTKAAVSRRWGGSIFPSENSALGIRGRRARCRPLWGVVVPKILLPSALL